MEDFKEKERKKANLIRTMLLVTVYKHCVQVNKVCKLKINSKSIDELNSLYESPEITINNPVEIGKPNRYECQEKVHSSSRHSSTKSLNYNYLKDNNSPYNEDFFNDTSKFVDFLSKKKMLLSELKLKINKESPKKTSKKTIQNPPLMRKDSFMFIENGNGFSKIANKSIDNDNPVLSACKFLRKIAKSLKKTTVFSSVSPMKHSQTNINAGILGNNSKEKNKYYKNYPGLKEKNKSCLEVSSFIHDGELQKTKNYVKEEIPKITNRRSFCTPVEDGESFLNMTEKIKNPKVDQQNNNFLSVSKSKKTKCSVSNKKLHEILSKDYIDLFSSNNKEEENTTRTSYLGGDTKINESPSPQKKNKKIKSFKKMLSLKTPNIKDKVYQVFGIIENKKQNNFTIIERNNDEQVDECLELRRNNNSIRLNKAGIAN